MTLIVIIACVVVAVFFALGFWGGWYVRGASVHRLERENEALRESLVGATCDPIIASTEPLIQDDLERALRGEPVRSEWGDPWYRRLQFRWHRWRWRKKSQSDVICGLLKQMRERKD